QGGHVHAWPTCRMPLKVYIAPGDRVADYKPYWKVILVRSFQDWQECSGNLVRFSMVEQESQADITCHFVDRTVAVAKSDAAKNEAEAGEAEMYEDSNGLTRGNINLLTRSMSA